MTPALFPARACELNVVDHCNLACRGCSHLAPYAQPGFLDPAEAQRDLSALARHFHAERLSLLGGEPLLHPDLPDLIDVARASGVADQVNVVTNGLLLGRMGESFWRSVDHVMISVYPGTEPPAAEMARCRRLARRHRVELEVRRFERFREPYAALGTDDARLTRRIYATCQVAHVWRCYNVHRGAFYKCPQAVFIPRILRPGDAEAFAGDRVSLDDPSFSRTLVSYLGSPEPLAACRYCMGTAGHLIGHEQIVVRGPCPQRRTEEVVDWEQLEALEASAEASPGFMQPAAPEGRPASRTPTASRRV